MCVCVNVFENADYSLTGETFETDLNLELSVERDP